MAATEFIECVLGKIREGQEDITRALFWRSQEGNYRVLLGKKKGQELGQPLARLWKES